MRTLVLVGCVVAAALSPARAADCEANKELYRHYIEELWNKRDQSAVDRDLAPKSQRGDCAPRRPREENDEGFRCG